MAKQKYNPLLESGFQEISTGGSGSGGTYTIYLDDSLSNVSRFVGSGATRYVVTHNLNTENVIVYIYNTSNVPVFIDYKVDSANDIQFYFIGTVNNNDYRIVIKY